MTHRSETYMATVATQPSANADSAKAEIRYAQAISVVSDPRAPPEGYM